MENNNQMIGQIFNQHKYQQSFSARICDDLCEVLLSYLSLEDKIQFECVSKQFQRCIYNKQNTVEINFHNISQKSLSRYLIKKSENKLNSYKKQINIEILERILKKCQFINQISITTQVSYDISAEDREQILQTITKSSPHLKSIKFDFRDISEETLEEFGLKFGLKLREISFYDILFIENYKFLLKLCPNLESVYFVRIEDLIDSNNKFLVPKLKRVSLCDINSELVDTFGKNLTQGLKYLGLSFHELDVYIESMKQFSCLKHLEHLRIDFVLSDNTNTPLDESLKDITANCPKIKRFDFYFTCRYLFPESDIFKNLHYFSQIETLVLDFNVIEFYNITTFRIDCLKGCKLLKHFKLRHPMICDNSLENIDIFLPQLRHLYIIDSGHETITDETFIYLSKLTKIKVISYERFRSHQNIPVKITDAGLCQVINNCPQIQSIRFKRGPNITYKTIDALICLAVRKPRICFNHFFGSLGFYCPVYDITDHYKKLPNNLHLIVSRDKETDEQFEKYNQFFS